MSDRTKIQIGVVIGDPLKDVITQFFTEPDFPPSGNTFKSEGMVYLKLELVVL